MQVRELGHVVLYVRNLERSLAFYRDLLGFRAVASLGGAATVLRGVDERTHHELLLIEVGEDAAAIPVGRRVGLYHIGLKIGDDPETLRAAYDELIRAGTPFIGAGDHTVTQSLYVQDPDGNEVEIYVDADPATWRDNPRAMLQPTRPLRL